MTYMLRRIGVVASALLAITCGRQSREPAVSQAVDPLFVNGGFEDGTLNGWTSGTNLNPGIATFPPTSIANLGLTSGGTAYTYVRTSATETQKPAGVPNVVTPLWPKFDTHSLVVNELGKNQNVNWVKQAYTTTSADVDPADGKIHVRFVLAPVLENPNHANNQQPYFYVNLANTTKATTLYSTFNFSNQPGVPWKSITDSSGNTALYTDWQLFDIAPGNVALSIGDTVEVEVIAAGCSLGGHWGEVYVDGFGAFIPSLSVAASALQFANANTDLTYTFLVKNSSGALVSNVVVDEVLPSQTTFVSVNAPGATCTTPSVGGTGTVSCNFGWMNPAASTTFTVTVHIASGATGKVSNGNYSVRGDAVSPLIGPLVETTITSGVTYTDLGLTVSDGVPAVGWGQPITYTIQAVNNGPTAVAGATVTDTFPAQLTGVTWTCAAAGGGSCGSALGSGNINTTVNLPVAATATFTVNANVVSGSGSGTLTNIAAIAAPGGVTDSDTRNNSDADVDGIGTLYTLTVDKVPAETGRGTVTSSPTAINCGTSCNSASADFLSGTLVSLTAVARSGDTFTGWTGACTGTSNTCNITISAATSATAHFDGPSVTASVASGSGTLVCDTPVLQGNSSTCLVSPAVGWILQSLTDNGTDVTSSVASGSYVISNVTANHAVVATFKKDLGTTCGAGTECHSGQCVDGVCCNVACAGQCQACDVLGYVGTCTPVSGAPHGSRTACLNGGATCGGYCDGSNVSACTFPGSSTSCRSPSCASGVETLAASCDGAGSCPTAQTQNCTPYICGSNACLTSCSVDGDCVSGDYCAAGACVPKKTNGQTCSGGNQCTSGSCVDGVCCNSACGGQCQACDVTGSVGTCTAVSGAPHGARSACTTDGTACGGTCNGVATSACTYPSTSCRNASCAAGVETLAASCNGAGSCPSAQTQDCSPYVCGSTACLTSCSGDGDCISGDYCAAGACVPKKANGQTCSATNQCTSDLCVDGVCCNAACTGQCQACDVSGSVGTCTPVPASGAPHGSRTACTGNGTTCGGACDGTTTSACAYPGGSTSCRSASCAAGVGTLAASCDGAGHCPSAQTQDCSPYVCGSTACLATCTADGQCAAGFFCSGGSCVAKHSPGTACGGAGECASGFCVDGVCCNVACSGQCEACDANGSVGTCTAVSGAPHGSRTACVGAGTTCGGTCNGTTTSICSYPGDTTPCRDASCTAGVATLAATCDGAGQCPTVQTQTCAPSTCGPTACLGNCVADGDCPSGSFCSGGICTTKLTDGTACSGPNQCQSGFCVDGVCCNAACGGQCEACDVTGSVGTCTAATGAPHGARPICTSDGPTCGGACDGSSRTACHYPDGTVSCRAASCSAGVATLAAGCDGAGRCPAVQTQPCAPNACGPTTCAGGCTVDTDCPSGSYCSAGACTTKLANGTPCAGPNQCQNGFCVDGVCCDGVCNGQCQACDVAGSVGSCTAVTGAPHGARTACAGTGSTCGGSCDGIATSSCSYPAGSVECRPASCTDVVATLVADCDGAGSCPAKQTQSCVPYACGATACLGNCSIDGDCALGYFCSAGICSAERPNGQACSGPSQCQSGLCVDGFCCDGACTGQCEACDVTGSVGTCSPVPATGTPHGARTSCVGSGTTCGGACDGSSRTACHYPDATVSCGAYTCDSAGACRTSCTTDSDCASSYWCFQSVCRPRDGIEVRGSGGCSTGGLSDLGPLALLALLLLGSRRRGRGVAVVLALALLPTLSRAQTTSFTVQRFQPAAGTYDVLGLSSARVPEQLELSGVLFLNYADRPLRLVGSGFETDLVRSQTAIDVGVSLGLLGRGEVSLVVPLTLSQSTQAAGSIVPSTPGGGGSDLRLVPKLKIWEGGPLALAATLPLTLPTANTGYLGQQGPTATPTAVVEWRGPRGLRALANVGVVLRGERTLLNLKVGPAFVAGIGAEQPFMLGSQSFHAMGTLAGEIGSGSGIVGVPLELLFALRWNAPRGFAFTVGGGPGLTDGYGSPRYRVLTAISLAPFALVRPPPEPQAPAPPEPPAEVAPEPPPAPAPVVEPPPAPAPAAPPRAVLRKERIAILDQVYFAPGLDRVLPRSSELLTQVAKVLTDNPWVTRVRVEGYTDDRGSKKQNQRLSQRRAAKVREHLVELGVAPDRLEAAGYGPMKPIATNSTEAGRARNRRVEFAIVSQELPEQTVP